LEKKQQRRKINVLNKIFCTIFAFRYLSEPTKARTAANIGLSSNTLINKKLFAEDKPTKTRKITIRKKFII